MGYRYKAINSIALHLKCIHDDVRRLVYQVVNISLDEHASYIAMSVPLFWQDSYMRFFRECQTYDQLKDLMYTFRTRLQKDEV